HRGSNPEHALPLDAKCAIDSPHCFRHGSFDAGLAVGADESAEALQLLAGFCFGNRAAQDEFLGGDVTIVDPFAKLLSIDGLAIVRGFVAVEKTRCRIVGDPEDDRVWGEIEQETTVV